MERRIESRASFTAELTCICRAGSSMEKNVFYKSGDSTALHILPEPIKTLLKIPFYRKLHFGLGAPKGLYEYIIVRTKYIDRIFQNALERQIVQIAILGAGYDTRAIRLPTNPKHVKIYEFDSTYTQELKQNLYRKNRITVPDNLVFAPINFEKENLGAKFEAIGFRKGQKCLFIIEGVTMYLAPSAVDAMFSEISNFMGKESMAVFDYIYSDVLRSENKHYGETATTTTVKKANESFQFGIEKEKINDFLRQYGLNVMDHLDAKEMESRYFTDEDGKVIHHVNDIHCLVTAEKQ
jgi:methyltransferase (TIGR00027 family)